MSPGFVRRPSPLGSSALAEVLPTLATSFMEGAAPPVGRVRLLVAGPASVRHLEPPAGRDQWRHVDHGSNHFARYAGAGEPLIVLRVATRALFAHNRDRVIRFSNCNSGSPRMSDGKPRPRGDSTFRVTDAFTGTPGQVKEIVIEDFAALPTEVEFAAFLAGPWQPL